MNIISLARFVPQRYAVKALRVWMRTSNLIRYGDSHFPQTVFIEINRHCNRSCVYCPNVSVPSVEGFMSSSDFLRILDRLKEIKWRGPVAYHMLSEPMLHPNLCNFIQYTLAARMIPILFTNGDFLTMEKADFLVKAGLRRCTVSKHKPFTVEYEQRIESIRARWPHIFRPYKPSDTPNLIFKSGSYTKMKSRKRSFCRTSELNMTIRYNGDYGLCHSDPKNLHNFGNAFEIGIMEAWRSPVWKQVRERLLSGHRDFEICKACDGII